LTNQEMSCAALGYSPESPCRAMRTEFLPPSPRKGVVEGPKQQQAFQFPEGNPIAKAAFKY